jgi:acetyltransferase-like isoleucine patch superfamily enzyme
MMQEEAERNATGEFTRLLRLWLRRTAINRRLSLYVNWRAGLHLFPFSVRVYGGSTWRFGRGAKLRVRGTMSVGRLDTRLGQVTQKGIDRSVIQLAERARLEIDGSVALGAGTRIILGPAARLAIGDQTFCVGNSSFIVRSEVQIGGDCAISWDVQIMDTDFHKIAPGAVDTAPVRIGNHVWIGSRATILKGVSIGDGAVIGAGTVVTRDVAPRQVVAGNPARVVGENVNWVL